MTREHLVNISELNVASTSGITLGRFRLKSSPIKELQTVKVAQSAGDQSIVWQLITKKMLLKLVVEKKKAKREIRTPMATILGQVLETYKQGIEICVLIHMNALLNPYTLFHENWEAQVCVRITTIYQFVILGDSLCTKDSSLCEVIAHGVSFV